MEGVINASFPFQFQKIRVLVDFKGKALKGHVTGSVQTCLCWRHIILRQMSAEIV